MKYLQLPVNYMEQPNIRTAIRKDEGFGELVLFNLIMKIGKEFQFGDWRRTGFDFDLVPYAYDMAINDWYSQCKVKDNEHEKFWDLMNELQKFDVIEFKKTEYSCWISVPQTSEMTDEVNMKKCRELFGRGRLTADELKLIAESKKELSGNIPEQIREENIKPNNTKTDSLANKEDIYKGNNTSSPQPKAKGSDDEHTFNFNGNKVSLDDWLEHQRKEKQRQEEDIPF